MSFHNDALHGKVVLLTGCTGAMGQELTLALAQMGATVLAVSRTRERGAELIRQIQARTGNPHVSLCVADLASQIAVRRLAQDVARQYQQLDVLINNAATYRATRVLTADGIELTFAVNYLAPFLLTSCLLPLLHASPAARIINVTAESHKQARLDLADLHAHRRYSFFQAAAQSKLALLMWSIELAERVQGHGMTVNAVHPGLVPTGTAAQYMPRAVQVVLKVLSHLPAPFIKSPRAGAQTTLYLAASRDVGGITGQYFINCRVARPHQIVYDADLRQRLWNRSVELTGESATI